MKKNELKREWYVDLAKGNADLNLIQAESRKRLGNTFDGALLVPPFKGKSRNALTRNEACLEIKCSLTFLDSKIRQKMIFPQYKGRIVMIPEEEIENYYERERLVRQAKYA